jgi:hypothetical protein
MRRKGMMIREHSASGHEVNFAVQSIVTHLGAPIATSAVDKFCEVNKGKTS